MNPNSLFLISLLISINNPIHMAIHIGGGVQKSLSSTTDKILFLKKIIHSVHNHFFRLNINMIGINR